MAPLRRSRRGLQATADAEVRRGVPESDGVARHVPQASQPAAIRLGVARDRIAEEPQQLRYRIDAGADGVMIHCRERASKQGLELGCPVPSLERKGPGW